MLRFPKILFIIILGFMYHTCIAQNHYFATLSNLKSRSLAMGGAFTSVEDDLEAVFYNPGTFNLYKNKKDHRITFFFNPISSYIAFKKYSNTFQEKINETNLGNASGLLIKAIVFSGRFFNTGIILSEESLKNIYNNQSPKWFELNDLWNNSVNTFFACFELAKRVSIGFSGGLYYNRNNNQLKRGIGFSYGIVLKPSNKFNFGLAYMDFPKNMSDFRLLLERMGDETMNIGVSYKPTSSTIFSMDIRNLTEENKENIRELHLGCEQSISGITALRLGFFKERFTSNYNYSFGIGILDSNLIFRNKNHFNHHDFMINYSFVYQEKVKKFNRWHFFSFHIRI